MKTTLFVSFLKAIHKWSNKKGAGEDVTLPETNNSHSKMDG